MPDLHAEYRGRALGREEAERLRNEIGIIALGPDYHESHVVHLFASEREFEEWMKAAGVSNRVEHLRTRIDAAQRKAAADPELMDHARAAERRMRAGLERLSAQTGLAIGSDDLLRRATIDRPHGEPPVFDSAILYADSYYGGRWLPIWQDCPDLRWFGFNDVTSSIKGIGEGALFSDVAFRGRSYLLLTNPLPPSFGVFSIPWLGPFNDIASSVIVYS